MNKETILEVYIMFVVKHGRFPSQEDLKAVTRAQVRTHFTNLEGLKAAALDTGKLTGHILDVSCLDTEYIKESLKKLNKHNKFVLVTAVTNAPVNKQYLDSVRTYCKMEKALLVVLPSVVNKNWTLDKELKDEVVLFYDYSFNSNIRALGLLNNAKSVDPITGLPRLGKRNGSIIVASPKQSLKIVPTGINKLPHALMSTGAITTPAYAKGNIMQARQDYLAYNDHVTGAVILELDKNDMFHFRQTQADNRGGFTDFGCYYYKGKKFRMAPEAAVLGDWHSGETDPKVVKGLIEITDKLKVKEWIIHDGFSGNSVNHHTVNKRTVLARMADAGHLNLKAELEGYRKDLMMMTSVVDKISIVQSNHDDFLGRYLDEARYVDDPHNHELALGLALDKIRGYNPIEKYVGITGLNWLKIDQSYKIAGIECGMHGHLGANGARGSAKSMEEAYGSVMYGHSHTPSILRNSWCVGTSTYLQLPYNKGASSWLNTSGLIYSNGVRQLINFIDGKYKV